MKISVENRISLYLNNPILRAEKTIYRKHFKNLFENDSSTLTCLDALQHKPVKALPIELLHKIVF